MKENNYAKAISIVATFTLLFMLSFMFNLTKSPFFLMLCSTSSLGYMLVLLGLYDRSKKLKTISYILIGFLLIFASVLLTFTMPRANRIFF